MKKIPSIVLGLIVGCNCLAFNVVRPSGLSVLKSATAYSARQDSTGAMWISTSYGIYRYNGHRLETVSPAIESMHRFSAGNNHLHAAERDGILRIDTRDGKCSKTSAADVPLQNAAILPEGDSLTVCAGNRIYISRGDSLVLRQTFRRDIVITSVLRSPSGELWAGTSNHGILILGAGFSIVETISDNLPVATLEQCGDGSIWAGLRKGGIKVFDGVTHEETVSIGAIEGTMPENVRTLTFDRNGTVYAGAVNGLFLISRDRNSEVCVPEFRGSPITDLFTDCDGNLWICTFYDGIFYADLSSWPFRKLDIPRSMHKIKESVATPDGAVWTFTDGYGLYRYAGDSWEVIPSSENIKFQCAAYDGTCGCIWAGEYTGDLLRIDSRTGRIERIGFDGPRGRTIVSIIKNGGDLYLAGEGGIYLFNPETEKSVSRKVGNINNFVYDLLPGKDGCIWVARQGLDVVSGDGTIHNVIPDGHWENLREGADGSIWAACNGRGIIVVNTDDVVQMDCRNTFMNDDYASCVLPLDGNMILIGTRGGVDIMSRHSGSCFHFDEGSGFSAGSLSRGSALMVTGSTIWLGGNDGIEILDTRQISIASKQHKPTVDKIMISGEQEDIRNIRDNHVKLRHGSNSFTVDIADFNYSPSRKTRFSYKMDGLDKDWNEFDIANPVVFMNMKPGRYVLHIQSKSSIGSEPACYDLKIRLHAVWYATIAAKIGFFLIALLIAAMFIRSAYSRTVLNEKLRLKENENMEKARHFHNISLELRTPLNIMISQLEQFFRDYGFRTKGIEDLDDIYMKAKRMRSIISEYVDERETEEPEMVLRHERFLNAATAAIERKLFSSELNVEYLASELNMGRTKLNQMMRESSGMSTREFIEDIKMRHAEQMLKDKTYRVSEIAERLGFSSTKYFAQRYKLKFGHTPTRNS